MKLHIQNRYKGGVKASRNNPKCYSKQNPKEMQSCKKMSFSRKHLSLESAYSSLGISENLINLLKVGASGDFATVNSNSFYPCGFSALSPHVQLLFSFLHLKVNNPLSYYGY